jgi:signal transduction histidine kinase
MLPTSQPLQLPARTASLNIAYTAWSLSVPERVRFRYKLEGMETEWRDAGTRREAFYTNLPPGSYNFRVTACNNDGVWNDVGAAIPISIPPAFFQTWWFEALCTCAGLSLIWMLYRVRLRFVTEQFQARMSERLEERERIARELHDTLLQSFQGLTLHFQRARNLLPDRALEAIQTLDTALDGAEEAIVEGRDAIHDLRTIAHAPKDLVEEVTSLGEELTFKENREIRSQFRVVVEGPIRTIRPEIHTEVFRIAREALRNSTSHSEAKLIETEIAYGDGKFRLRIRDDGKGIDHLVRTRRELAGHWGLAGMRERAKRIGGELEVWSEPGAGTEVELSIPASIAYVSSPPHNNFRLLWRKMRNGDEHSS